MWRLLCTGGWLIFCSGLLQAAVTPMNAPLAEDKLTNIECDYKCTRAEAALLGSYEPTENPLKAPLTGICHYQLYVPPGYLKNTDKKYPVIFVASPKAEPYMDNVKARAARDGWIVVLLADTKSMDPVWLGNFLGAHDDVIKRTRIIEDFKVTTGSKGGGLFSSAYPVFRTGFKAYIGQSSCFWEDSSGPHRYDAERLNKEFAVYQILGMPHPSFRCRHNVRADLPRDTYHMVECYDAGDAWAQAEAMDRALDWIEKTVFLDARSIKFSKDALMWHYDNKMTALEKATSPFAKYELMEYVISFAKKQNLITDKTIKDKIQIFEKELPVLFKDESVRKELAARMQFLIIAQADNRTLADSKKAWQLINAYRALAKQAEDTVYGRKAGPRAESLVIDFTF